MFSLYCVPCAVCGVQWAVWSVPYLVFNSQCLVFSVHYSIKCAVYSVQCAVFSLKCIVCSVQYRVYSVQCAVCSVQCAALPLVSRMAGHSRNMMQGEGIIQTQSWSLCTVHIITTRYNVLLWTIHCALLHNNMNFDALNTVHRTLNTVLFTY